MTQCRDRDQFVLVTVRIHRDLVPVVVRLARKAGENFLDVAGELLQSGVEADRKNRSGRRG